MSNLCTGGWFCKAFGDLKKSSGKKFNTKALRMWRISYVSLINSVVMFVLPMMSWVCHEDDLEDATGAEQQFFCEEGKKNQMATIFFGSRAKAIVRMLSNPGQFYASTLAIVGLVFFAPGITSVYQIFDNEKYMHKNLSYSQRMNYKQ